MSGEAIAAILLAAGRSRRFGSGDKLLAPLCGKPLILHAAAAIARLDCNCRIAVCANEAVAELLSSRGYCIVSAEGTDAPMSRSLAAGIAEASALGAAAALVCLGDMPFITAAHLDALLRRRRDTLAPVMASSNGKTPMPPAIFDRSCFAALTTLHGDRGAREMLAGAQCVEAPRGTLRDIDTEADLSAFG